MAILSLPPNTPTEIALRFPDGKQVEGRFGDQVMYSLVEPPDHVIYLDLDVAAKLNILEPRPKEIILACKRSTGKRGDKPQWDFWRPNAGETKPRPGTDVSAPAPAAPTAVGSSASTINGNGTRFNGSGNGYNGNGHGAPSPTLVRVAPLTENGRAIDPALPVPPTKIPLNIAVIEAVQMVQVAMQATGEQWSDSARQDLVSTILITGQKEGWLAPWERSTR